MYETKEERDKFYSSREWRNMRHAIRKRDNFECQECKRQGRATTPSEEDSAEEKVTLIVDHIIELEVRPDLALEPDNLEVKCFTCHEIRHDRMFKGSNGKKTKWDDEWWG